jgi:hypothetical protein
MASHPNSEDTIPGARDKSTEKTGGVKKETSKSVRARSTTQVDMEVTTFRRRKIEQIVGEIAVDFRTGNKQKRW